MAVLVYDQFGGGAGIRRGYVHGKSDKTASSPLEDPVHPSEVLATVYHAFGIDPQPVGLGPDVAGEYAVPVTIR